MPLGVRTLQFAVLSGCTKLKHIELHDKLVKIGHSALAYTGIEEIEIPKSVKKVLDTSFNGCKNIKRYEKLKG